MSTTAVMDSGDVKPMPKGRSLWNDAYKRLKRDKGAIFCFFIIVFFAILALAAKFGMVGATWDQPIGASYAPPSDESFAHWLGLDIFGRSVMYKVIHGARVAMSVGLVTSLIAIPFGAVLGALAGYFGGFVDEFIQWFYTTVSSIPNIMLLVAIAFVFGKGIGAIYISIGATSWVSTTRVIRGEFLKHKNREYVHAATSLGASHTSRIFKHILPNVFHQIIINISMQFLFAIKSEVILSYLGLGIQGQPSWGVMIDDAKLELGRGVWWQLAGASAAMFALILAFNIFGDALRDALDPKTR